MAHRPHNQSSQVERINKLPQRLAGTENTKLGVRRGSTRVPVALDAIVHATDHARNDVTDAGRKVVVRPKDVARHNGRKEVAVLLEVGSIGDVDQSFGVAVAEIWWVRRSIVDL